MVFEADRIERQIQTIQAFTNLITDFPSFGKNEILQIQNDYNNKPINIEAIVDQDIVSKYNYPSVLTYNIGNQYNYYVENFESLKNETSDLETGLPNLYIFGDKKNLNLPVYRRAITVGNNIQFIPENPDFGNNYFDQYAELYKSFIDRGTTGGTTIGLASAADNVNNLFQTISTIQKKIYFNKSCINNFKTINENRFLLPFENSIKFKTHGPSTFAGILEQTDFIDLFCKQMAVRQSSFARMQISTVTNTVTIENELLKTATVTGSGNLPGFGSNSIDGFIGAVRDYILNFTASANDILELGTSDVVNSNSNTSNSLSKAIRLKLFTAHLRSMIETLKKSPDSFFNSPHSLSDVFMYEIVKTSSGSNTPIQTFYLPNLNGLQQVDFFDSQVKFEKNYNYILNCFSFAVKQNLNFSNITDQQWSQALTYLYNNDQTISEILVSKSFIYSLPEEKTTKFTYEKIIVQDGDDFREKVVAKKSSGVDIIIDKMRRGTADSLELTKRQADLLLKALANYFYKNNINIFQYSYIIFKNNVFQEQMLVSDNPPPPPEVRIDTMIGVDNKIMFTLKGSINELKAVPNILEMMDGPTFIKNVISQKLSGLDDVMTFNGDDRIEFFKIYRSEQYPESYMDFNLINIVSTTTNTVNTTNNDFNIYNTIKTNHSVFIDNVEPNKKYYYIFTSVDIHSNISNPTPIYEIEIINLEGTIYSIIKNVELKQPDYKQPSLNLKRFLYISPNVKQSLINENRSGFFEENGNSVATANLVKDKVVLGLTENTIWNKRYRLKVKSKMTGKIIEIDFKFVPRTITQDNY